MAVQLVVESDGGLQSVKAAKIVVQPQLLLECQVEALGQFLVDAERETRSHFGIEVHVGLCPKGWDEDREAQQECGFYEGFHVSVFDGCF